MERAFPCKSYTVEPKCLKGKKLSLPCHSDNKACIEAFIQPQLCDAVYTLLKWDVEAYKAHFVSLLELLSRKLADFES